MTTLLVNPKMNPALARRVEVAVTGRASQSSVRLSRWMRIAFAAGLAGVIAIIYLSLRHEYAAQRQVRDELASQWGQQARELTERDRGFLKRVETKLVELANQYPGDFVADELKADGVFSELLARPAVYVRGPLGAFSGSKGVERVATESGKDALLLCLLDPPAARDEKSLLEKARATVIGDSTLRTTWDHVFRLYDAEAALPLLEDSFAERINDADSREQIALLARQFKAAPVSRAKRAAQSEVLIAAFDEPNDKATATELDGEAPHTVRLAVLNLDKMTPWLRVRRHVDPSWISANRRPQYARELDGCRLALDVRSTLKPKAPW